MSRREFFGMIATAAMAATLSWRHRAKLRVLYWVAQDGRWDDPACWSRTDDGSGGAGIPDEKTEVFILGRGEGTTTHVWIGPTLGEALCARLTLAGNGGTVIVDGEATLYIGCRSDNPVTPAGTWAPGKSWVELSGDSPGRTWWYAK